MTEFADSQLTFVDLAGEAWGSFRLEIGGKDVTYFRDVPVQIAGYQLVEPYGYGPADFNLPQLSMFEVDDWGTGGLKWFGQGKPVRLKQVDASGAKVRPIWRGFVSILRVTSQGVQVHCEGDATGKLALRNKHPDLFALKDTVGRKVYNALNHCRLDMTPHLGGGIGAETDGRGFSGSYLDYVDWLLTQTIDTDGSQYTVKAKDAGGYHLALKDTDTVDVTMFLGATGVDADLTSDISEKPNSIYGSGVDPDGMVWVNGKYPGLEQGVAPDYPMTDDSSFGSGTVDADTDSGDGVTVMVMKLIGMGYMGRKQKPGDYDADVVEAVKDLQDDAGLSQTGTMNTATWNALWDLDITGFSLLQSFIAPLAQSTKVRAWNTSSNGSRIARNPDYDPTIIIRDLTVDHGTSVEKARARHWSKGVLNRAQTEKNWAGTITLTSDVFSGDVDANDGDLADHAMSRLDITAGMNVLLRHFDGATQFHVSIVNVSVDPNAGIVVQLGVDTQARDAATLGEVIARNIESRSHPARSWKRQHLSGVNFRRVEFSEVGGQVFNKISLNGLAWNVFPVVAGQAGTVNRVRLQTSDDPASFVMAVFAQKVSPAWLNQHIGNPFDVNADGESKWTNANVQSWLDNQRALLGAWGDEAQPCGYHPRRHTNDSGDTTDAPITGLMLEDAGFDYHTFSQPVVWVCVYPKTDTVIKPQRVLWEVFDSSQGL